MSDEFGAGIADVATMDTATDSAVATETPTTETTTQDTNVETNDTPELGADEAEGSEQEATDEGAQGTEEDGTPKEPTAQGGVVTADIKAQRAALRELRDLDPEKYGKVVKTIHNAVERWNAAAELLGKGEGAGIVGLKTFMQEVGAKTLPELRQAYADQAKLQSSVQESDRLLAEASPELAKNVYEELQSTQPDTANEVYGKTIANFLDHLKEVSETDFYAVTKPHMVSGLTQAGLPTALNAIYSALNAGDSAKAKSILEQTGKWFSNLRDEVSEEGKAKTEAAKLAAAKQSWTEEKGAAERKALESDVAGSCDRYNNTSLGKQLAPFLKLPFFKELSANRASLVDLGNSLKQNLYRELSQDKTYTSQMKAMLSAKQPDKAKIEQYHRAKLDSIGARLVRDTIQLRWPGYAKSGAAGGRIAAATAKKEADAKAGAQSVTSGKPLYVAARPTNLVREDITVNGKSYTTSDLQTLQITGKGFVKTTDGKGFKFVTWRK